ncbi:FdhB6 [Desulforapulum autotrophicum HRM2]|uniref:FdhB6 n=1 Tax=Desulforapulum autotrophicum (strain ATCC 43914 / DSM 3382 / VKM B-1955 / HRM2) TaxID=177437 RepID=C0QEM7_DESAH|nr:Coenzyme F420 hydrogenase/dehydrogenase, beta subunit C-terminal domain [Desulforapulum autotrophicum]ACN15369.1 FdhB6 [Desulforapulum autotrophicum HRM2]
MEDAYEIKGKNRLDALRVFLATLFEKDDIGSMLIPLESETTHAIMPTLVSDPAALAMADPFAPFFPLNGAKLVSKLTKRPTDETVAVVLRPCELRALVELVKIKQARMDHLITISFDCPGAYPNKTFNQLPERGGSHTLEFLAKRFASGFEEDKALPLSTACTICTSPFPENADICITLVDQPDDTLGVFAGTDRGQQLLMGLALGERPLPKTRKERLKAVLAQRVSVEKKVFEDLTATTSTLEGLGNYLSACVNCYNCRVACPVCFCRECVFNTDVFDYEPFQYATWSKNRGTLRMPMDTVFFHMTRMIHMGLSCVGCGQCSNACPNDIPLAELFTSVGKAAQKGFGYRAGANLAEPFPLSVFFEDEFQDVTGI